MIHVRDSMQTYDYTLSAPAGEEFDSLFQPDLTPKDMLKLGVFGGNYFAGEHGEFPDDWFVSARLSDVHDPMQNYFEIDASQPLALWREKGWVFDDDPRGWFQWYCRYYQGRRLPDEDKRQIQRWRNMTRHIGQLKAHCAPGELGCRRKQRQALLH